MLNEYKESIEKLVPLSQDSIKKLIPNQIGEYEAEKVIAGNRISGEILGLEVLFVNQQDRMKQFSVELLDGAGRLGFIVLNATREKLKGDYEEKLDTGFRKVYSKDGLRIMEEFDLKSYSSEIEFIYHERFFYRVKAFNMTQGEVWMHIQGVL